MRKLKRMRTFAKAEGVTIITGFWVTSEVKKIGEVTKEECARTNRTVLGPG